MYKTLKQEIKLAIKRCKRSRQCFNEMYKTYCLYHADEGVTDTIDFMFYNGHGSVYRQLDNDFYNEIQSIANTYTIRTDFNIPVWTCDTKTKTKNHLKVMRTINQSMYQRNLNDLTIMAWKKSTRKIELNTYDCMSSFTLVLINLWLLNHTEVPRKDDILIAIDPLYSLRSRNKTRYIISKWDNKYRIVYLHDRNITITFPSQKEADQFMQIFQEQPITEGV